MKRTTPELPDGFADPKLPTGTFSHSQYTTFKSCGEAYYRRYILKQRTPASPSMFRGTVVHGGVEEALVRKMADKPASREELLDHVDGLWERGKHEVERWNVDEPPSHVKDQAVAGFRHWFDTVYPTVRPVAVEEYFAIKVGTVPTTGFIDLIDRVDGTNVKGQVIGGHDVIADLKTGATTWSQADLDLDPQFTLYSLARGILNVRVDSIAYLKTGPKHTARHGTRDARSFRLLIEDYERTVDLIKRGSFPLAPIDHWVCTEKFCGHWANCRGKDA